MSERTFESKDISDTFLNLSSEKVLTFLTKSNANRWSVGLENFLSLSSAPELVRLIRACSELVETMRHSSPFLRVTNLYSFLSFSDLAKFSSNREVTNEDIVCNCASLDLRNDEHHRSIKRTFFLFTKRERMSAAGRPKGHKQKGAGTVVVSKGQEVSRDGLTIKEWQKTPKQLLREYAQSEKRPLPKFITSEKNGKFSTKVVLADAKGNSKLDIVLTPDVSLDSSVESEHAAALLGLHKVEPSRGKKGLCLVPCAMNSLDLCRIRNETT